MGAGVTINEVWCKQSISSLTYYKWKVRCGGFNTLVVKHMKELEVENHRPKQMYAGLSLEH